MLGILYLVIAVFWGSAVCTLFFPDMADWTKRSFKGEKIKLCSLFLAVPAWVYTGLIPMTWLVYILSYTLRRFGNGMLYANLAVMGVFLLSGVLIYAMRGMRGQLRLPGVKSMAPTVGELIFLALVLYLSVRLFWTTFFVEGNTLYVGLSVFSDFSPHLGMIRSFSSGNNFPTVYSHFAGEDIKYHFMFQFLVGNLEYLGLRLDLAFNIPSAVGMVSTFLLLYVFSVKLTGRRAVGCLASLLFAFRSSWSVFRYLAQQKGGSLWEAFTQNSEFIGYTPNENWGLWNLNVYCNQRHLAFTLGVLVLALIMFTPHLYAMVVRLRLAWENAGKAGMGEGDPKIQKGIRFFLRESLFSAAGWGFKNPAMAVFAGILLGALAFWNGAVTIAALLVLFIMAAVSDHRLDFLVAALLAVALAVLQSMVFIDGSAVSASFYYGFISENRTVFGVLDYIFRLTGPALFVTAAAFLLADVHGRIMTVAFAAPFLFAFHISLTTDVTVNHKYIMISMMLFGIMEAHVLVRLWEQKKIALRTAAAFLVLLLTITGIFDYITVLNRNQKQNNLAFDTEAPVSAWIRENATAQDIFLTSNYALNNVVLGGAMLYDGWQYFAWSAGYDTAYRDRQVRLMYEAGTVQELAGLVAQNHIRYIIVDHDNRTSADYEVREDVIAAAYEPVYTQGEGALRLTIYDVRKPLFSE